jgi:hypothetical protein
MHNAYIVTGELTDERTVTLDESLPLKPMRVRLIVAPVTAPVASSYRDVIPSIRDRQAGRGFQPRTRRGQCHLTR